MANVKELKRVRTHIRRYPEKVDMDTWVCGTTACIAGRVALLNGWKPVDDEGGTNLVIKDGKHRTVDDVAQDILELDLVETSLFYTRYGYMAALDRLIAKYDE